jgi:integrase
LNCGFANAELASLQPYEINDIDGENPCIERRRVKTNVFARWWLFPETVDLLRTAMAERKGQSPVFVTAKGQPLTEANAIGQSWSRLLERSNVAKPLPFKFLRKTGAWLVRKQAGTDVAEMFLSHSDKGMIKNYAGRNWDELADALRAVRLELLPLFEVDAAKREQATACAEADAKAEQLRAMLLEAGSQFSYVKRDPD